MIKKILQKINNQFDGFIRKLYFRTAYRRDLELEDLAVETRRGNPVALAKRLKMVKDYPPDVPLESIEEYKDGIFVLEGPQGASIGMLKAIILTSLGRTGDYRKDKRGIRFFAKVIGFQDDNAPDRNWGMDMKELNSSAQGGVV